MFGGGCVKVGGLLFALDWRYVLPFWEIGGLHCVLAEMVCDCWTWRWYYSELHRDVPWLILLAQYQNSWEEQTMRVIEVLERNLRIFPLQIWLSRIGFSLDG